MKTLVNKKEVIGIGFIWDGCHKIYIIQTPEELNEAKRYGYTDRDFYTINKLKTIYDKSCPLRFIETFDLKNNRVIYAEQFTDAIIEEV